MLGGINNVFDVLATRMDYLKQRQAVIGQNVANADTPGYKARELESFKNVMAAEGSRAVGPVAISLTNQKHIAPAGTRVGGEYADAKNPSAYEIMPTGNNVILEEQMVKVAEISADYQLATNLYKRMQGMVRMAIGRAAG